MGNRVNSKIAFDSIGRIDFEWIIFFLSQKLVFKMNVLLSVALHLSTLIPWFWGGDYYKNQFNS